MKYLLLILSLLTALPCAASTAQIDGNDLLKKCNRFFTDTVDATVTDHLDTGYCAGYIAGVTDVERMWKAVEGASTKSSQYCEPEDVTNGQVLKILKKWLDNHPEKLHWRAEMIIHDALLEAFPCK